MDPSSSDFYQAFEWSYYPTVQDNFVQPSVDFPQHPDLNLHGFASQDSFHDYANMPSVPSSSQVIGAGYHTFDSSLSYDKCTTTALDNQLNPAFPWTPSTEIPYTDASLFTSLSLEEPVYPSFTCEKYESWEQEPLAFLDLSGYLPTPLVPCDLSRFSDKLQFNPRRLSSDSSSSSRSTPSLTATSASPPSSRYSSPTPDSSSASRESSPCRSEFGASSRRRFPCTVPGCVRRFTSQYTLKVHVAAHRPKPKASFPCTLGCAERFSRQHDRLRHEVAKHGKVCEWSCEDCGRFFSSSKTLGNHKCPVARGGTRWVN